MKNYIKYIAVGLFMALGITSCDLEEMNINPNNATTSEPYLLLTDIAYNTFDDASMSIAYAIKMLVYTAGTNTYQWYTWTRGTYDDYSMLRNVVKMEELAEEDENDAYIALALFFKAHYFYRLTMMFGDVPCSEALKGESEEIYQPAYDSQEEVLETILEYLDEANTLLTDNETVIDGDIIYDGDLTQWRQLINAYRLRVLMSLSGKTTVGSINIQDTFADIVSNEPLMSSSSDNGQLVFLDQEDNRYTFYNDSNFGSGVYMDSTYIAAFRIREDPRLFAIAGQTPTAETQGLAIDDFSAYDGGDPAVAYSLVNDKVTEGNCSKPVERYYNDPTNEPMILLGYTEQQLILAEAVVRGWISGDDQEYYESAVKASFDFYETYATDVAEYLDDSAAETYLQGEYVAYDSSLTDEEKIERIIVQKYLPSFLQGNYFQPYYEQLRTGYPEFRRSSGTDLPYRFMYPLDEYTNNADNVTAACQSQWDGSDLTSCVPWWLQ